MRVYNYLLLVASLVVFLNTARGVDAIPYTQSSDSAVTIVKQEEKTGDVQYKVSEKVNMNDYTAPMCVDVPLVFTKCIPSVCMEKAPFGTTYKEIKGFNNDTGECFFQERTGGLGGLNCKFKKEELTQVEALYTRKSQALADKSKKLSQQEIENLRILNEQKCRALSDDELQQALLLDLSRAPKEEKKPEVKVDAQPEIQTKKEEVVETPKPVESKDVKVTSSDNLESEKKELELKSVMFTEQELSLIDESIRAFKAGTGVAGTSLNQQAEQQVRRYHLNSILYKASDEWIIWINNAKVTKEGGIGLLNIEDVTEKYAIIKWSTGELDRIVPDWKRKLLYVNQNRYKARSEDGDITVETRGEANAVVTFKLEPNQTFDVNSMKIKEGENG